MAIDRSAYEHTTTFLSHESALFSAHEQINYTTQSYIVGKIRNQKLNNTDTGDRHCRTVLANMQFQDIANG